MPVYEYQCGKCSRIFEIWQKINDKPPERCPDCAGSMHKLVSLSSFHLKGGGWYVDGYSDIPDKGKNGAERHKAKKITRNSGEKVSKKKASEAADV